MNKIVAKEPKRPRARPTLYGEKMVQVAFHLTKAQRDWVKANGGAAKVRELISEQMKQEG